ncbi:MULTISPECIES: FAD-binding oxidoreductase [unclassified Streptomyces]|uniref:FAD-binding oxidoreductase n=1 Tax=unclassified Streptomyces TaxID=2593676 RepID=UPI002DD837A7|nr:FAD-binding oxidoreductase [Streptomyces sp. NBC_01750]WSA99696.1 FAD-binding oxidoreductase [Streptomyces sp. NBC_01794]WSD35855.1 FAD-binding oxidoreductase [Streptomyces sp. NBC_01750]
MTAPLGRIPLSVGELTDEQYGQVIRPGGAEYEAARSVYAGDIDRRPAVILRPENATQVASVVALARETGLELAVRSGGHSPAGHSVCEGGIVLDLSSMRALEIDVEARTAWAETGITAGEYAEAAAEHGLATGFGDGRLVGVGGITLGGGIGYLTRKHGMTIDDLLAAEIVTADGELLVVDEHDHPDLFWAIRGGGGNFGVATRFKFRLHELDGVYGGMMVTPVTPEILEAFVAEAVAAPEELSTIINVWTAPPFPFVPAEYHGKPIILAMLCYAGPAEEGEKVIGRFRAIVPPLADMVQAMPYTGMFPPADPLEHPISVSRNMFIDQVDRETAELILERVTASSAMVAGAQLRVLGGAMARVPNDATAFAHRQSKIMAHLSAIYADAAEADVHATWVDEFMTAMRQSDSGAYVNFIMDVTQEQIRNAVFPGATGERLAQVKAKYDPTNLFRSNHNITPAMS